MTDEAKSAANWISNAQTNAVPCTETWPQTSRSGAGSALCGALKGMGRLIGAKDSINRQPKLVSSIYTKGGDQG